MKLSSRASQIKTLTVSGEYVKITLDNGDTFSQAKRSARERYVGEWIDVAFSNREIENVAATS